MYTATLCDTISRETVKFELDIPSGRILGSLPFRMVGKHPSEGMNMLARQTLDASIKIWANEVHKKICEQTGEDPESMTIINCGLLLGQNKASGILYVHLQDNDMDELLSSITVFV